MSLSYMSCSGPTYHLYYSRSLKLHCEEVEELKQENEQTINTLKQQHEANERVHYLNIKDMCILINVGI